MWQQIALLAALLGLPVDARLRFRGIAKSRESHGSDGDGAAAAAGGAWQCPDWRSAHAPVADAGGQEVVAAVVRGQTPAHVDTLLLRELAAAANFTLRTVHYPDQTSALEAVWRGAADVTGSAVLVQRYAWPLCLSPAAYHESVCLLVPTPPPPPTLRVSTPVAALLLAWLLVRAAGAVCPVAWLRWWSEVSTSLLLGAPCSRLGLRHIPSMRAAAAVAVLAAAGVALATAIQASLVTSLTAPQKAAAVSTLRQASLLGLPVWLPAQHAAAMADALPAGPLRASLCLVQGDTRSLAAQAATRRQAALLAFKKRAKELVTRLGSHRLHLVTECPRSFHLSLAWRPGWRLGPRAGAVVSGLVSSGVVRHWRQRATYRRKLVQRSRRRAPKPRALVTAPLLRPALGLLAAGLLTVAAAFAAELAVFHWWRHTACSRLSNTK